MILLILPYDNFPFLICAPVITARMLRRPHLSLLLFSHRNAVHRAPYAMPMPMPMPMPCHATLPQLVMMHLSFPLYSQTALPMTRPPLSPNCILWTALTRQAETHAKCIGQLWRNIPYLTIHVVEVPVCSFRRRRRTSVRVNGSYPHAVSRASACSLRLFVVGSDPFVHLQQ